ncbi:GreA/GreB family elongation factor [Patescibacteria group bacterium]|nr:GreA/GreB family elongation factor [Patescibacteria group bacterium]
MDDLKISLDSPIGNAIDGKKKGDIVYVKLANGKRKVTILSVS